MSLLWHTTSVKSAMEREAWRQECMEPGRVEPVIRQQKKTNAPVVHSLFIQPGTQVHGTVPLAFRVVLSTSVKPLETPSQPHSEAHLQGDSKFHQDQLSQ